MTAFELSTKHRRRDGGKGVKLHLRDERRDGRTETRLFLRLSVRSFVRLSLSVVFVRGVHPIGERTAMLHRNLRRGRIKSRDHPINTRNFSVDYQENH